MLNKYISIFSQKVVINYSIKLFSIGEVCDSDSLSNQILPLFREVDMVADRRFIASNANVKIRSSAGHIPTGMRWVWTFQAQSI
jgi:hypothetical protein